LAFFFSHKLIGNHDYIPASRSLRKNLSLTWKILQAQNISNMPTTATSGGTSGYPTGTETGTHVHGWNLVCRCKYCYMTLHSTTLRRRCNGRKRLIYVPQCEMTVYYIVVVKNVRKNVK